MSKIMLYLIYHLIPNPIYISPLRTKKLYSISNKNEFINWWLWWREKNIALEKKNANTNNLTRKWHFNSTLSKLLNIMFFFTIHIDKLSSIFFFFFSFLFITEISKLIKKIKEKDNKVYCFQSAFFSQENRIINYLNPKISFSFQKQFK